MWWAVTLDPPLLIPLRSWGSIPFLLGIVGGSLSKLELRADDCVHDDLQWLGSLAKLEELNLFECLGGWAFQAAMPHAVVPLSLLQF